MKPKWYLSTFILIVAFLGAGLQQFSAPNQEIVLQFEDKAISLVETENAIANIKKQLQDIGVEKIQVYKGANGVLKISYFSEIDVVSIKKIFSKEKKETLDKGLEKSKDSFFGKLTKAVAGKSKVDDDVLDNLEEVLVCLLYTSDAADE